MARLELNMEINGGDDAATWIVAVLCAIPHYFTIDNNCHTYFDAFYNPANYLQFIAIYFWHYYYYFGLDSRVLNPARS